ncbi:hypothetical protein [Candidatus Ruminimicrobium bovinum]|uniref:hypothetical protein n=1 Tax=Candidatus Ruminimicrobium bovinum TaxID=3242779 RepID=UPI0039B9645E
MSKFNRWQYFFVSNDKVNAVFSIETDKGVFCFQVNENRILFIPTNVMAELYPDIVPKGYKA